MQTDDFPDIYVYTKGDPSVGIQGDQVHLKGMFVDNDTKEDLRKELSEFMTRWLGEPAEVIFSTDPPEPDYDDTTPPDDAP